MGHISLQGAWGEAVCISSLPREGGHPSGCLGTRAGAEEHPGLVLFLLKADAASVFASASVNIRLTFQL